MSMARRLREVSADSPRAGQERTGQSCRSRGSHDSGSSHGCRRNGDCANAIVAVDFVASVPGAGLLAAAALILNLAQLGPWLVMLPAVG